MEVPPPNQGGTDGSLRTPTSQPDIHTSGRSPWGDAVSRRSTYRSGVSRDAVQFFWIVVLLVASVVLWATGWGTAILGWAGDLILAKINEIGTLQPE